MESNDIITITPAEVGAGINIELNSPVIKQFGKQMRAVIAEVLKKYDVADVNVLAYDKGALDCTIRVPRLSLRTQRSGVKQSRLLFLLVHLSRCIGYLAMIVYGAFN